MQLCLIDPAVPSPPCSLLPEQGLLSSLGLLSLLLGVCPSIHCIDGVVLVCDHLATRAIDVYPKRWISPGCPISSRVPIVASLYAFLYVILSYVPLLNCALVKCMVALFWYHFFCPCWLSSDIYLVRIGELFDPTLS